MGYSYGEVLWPEPTTEKPKTPPPPTPPEPPRNVAKEAEAKIASMKTGYDPFRPFRYAAAFIKGTIEDTLTSMIKFGRKGVLIGIVIGVAVWFGTGGAAGLLYPMVMCGFYGAGGGVALGAAKGLVFGGPQAVGRLNRGERYADDLVERAKVQRSAGKYGKGDYWKQRRERIDAIDVAQLDAREKEFAKDYDTYWRDRVSSATNYDRGMGY